LYTGSFAINAEKDTANTINGSGYATTAGNPYSAYIDKIIPVSVPGYKSMSIIEIGEQNSSHITALALTDEPVKLGTTVSKADDSYQSKTMPGDRISFYLGFFGQTQKSLNFAYTVMPQSNFESLKDYNTAINILKSISYQ
jgi:hypothetical protein